MQSRYFSRIALCLVLTLLMSGLLAAQVPANSPLAGTGIEPDVVGSEEYDDPLIRFNRVMFAFNDVSYRYVLIPAARAYEGVTPAFARTSIANFFNNIKTPIPLASHLLQLQPQEAAVDLVRFLINSTLGIAGLFDPASEWFQLEREDISMKHALTHYGMGYGTYLVLPLAGPSNLRDGSAMLMDSFLNPLNFALDNPESIELRAFDSFQRFAPSANNYLELREQSEDLYIFMRNLHLQGIERDAQYK